AVLRLPRGAQRAWLAAQPADHHRRAAADVGRRAAPGGGVNLDAVVEAGFAPAAAAVTAGRIPGAALGVVDAGGARAVALAGAAQLEPAREPLDRRTWFDLASLTKPIFTTTSILRLV